MLAAVLLSLLPVVEAQAQMPEGLTVGADSAVLMDAASGQVLAAENPDAMMAPASLTKIMTLVLAFEAVSEGRASLDDMVTASPRAASFGGTTIFLEAGEAMSLRDLLLGVAVASGNDASVAVAEHLGGTEEAFVHMMNQKAQELGMRNTQFKNSHGLDEEGHYTTAMDFAILSSYASTLPGLLEMTSIYQEYLRDGSTWLVNRNRLVRFYEGADGLKTGHTSQARYCLAATAKKEGLRLVAVVMGADTSDIRFEDTRALFSYGFARFESLPVVKKGETVHTISVWKGTCDQVGVVAARDLSLTVPKGTDVSVDRRINLPVSLEAPLKKGDTIGEMIVVLDGSESCVDLIVQEDVPRIRVLPLMWRFLKSLWVLG